MASEVSNYLLFPDQFEKQPGIIGKGRNGEVVKMKEIASEKIYATKVLEVSLDEADDQKRFMREIETLIMTSNKGNPVIVGFHGFTTYDKTKNKPPMIMTDYFEGGSLQKVLAKQPPEWWNPTAQNKVIIGLCEGMRFLHDNNIIHRSLKPSNILFDDNNEPHIIDFGLSKLQSSFNDLQKSMAFDLGNIYTSPELITLEEGQSYSNKVDVFSFGMLLFTVLTGKEPFAEVKNTTVKTNKIMNGERPDIPDTVSNVYKELIEVCWDTLPENRPSFDYILLLLSKPEYIVPGADKAEVRKYLLKVVKYLPSIHPQLEPLFPLANSGDKVAQTLLAFKLLNGGGVIRNEAEGVRFLRIAANSGYPLAQVQLARCLLVGKGCTRDVGEAIELLEDAASKDCAAAECAYGEYLLDANPELAVDYFLRSANHGSVLGSFQYANCLMNGVGGKPKNPQLAIARYRDAADKGCVPAMLAYATCAEAGIGMPKDHNIASEYLLKANSYGGITRFSNKSLRY